MNNFIFQNSTKVYFGKGCVKEYLACLTKKCADYPAGLWRRQHQAQWCLR